ncbi:hypothetical protein GVAV_001494 [Gurleya vavrai]
MKIEKICSIRNLIYKMLFFALNLINFYSEMNSIECFNNLNVINTNIDNYYQRFFDNFPTLYIKNLTFIFNRNSVLIKHKKINKKSVYFYDNSKPNEIEKINIEDIEKHIKNKTEDWLYIMDDPLLIEYYKKLKLMNRKVYVMEDIFKNMTLSFKYKTILTNINLILSLIENKKLDNYKLKYINFEIEKTEILNTIYYKPIIFDDIHYIMSYPNQNFLKSKEEQAKQFYFYLKSIWKESLREILKNPNKILWSDFIIEKSLMVLFSYKILKKKINIKRTPEIITYLFPIKFVCTKHENFTNNEMIRFCISFKTIKQFKFYNEYFNDHTMDYYIKNIPEVCFTEIITSDTINK